MSGGEHELSALQRDFLRAFFDRERGFFLTGGGALDRDGVLVDPIEEIVANKLTAVVGRMEERDLVDLYVLEQAGHPVENFLEAALRKDGGCTPATLAWLLSDVRIAEDAKLPGGVDGRALGEWLESVVVRLRRAAAPRT